MALAGVVEEALEDKVEFVEAEDSLARFVEAADSLAKFVEAEVVTWEDSKEGDEVMVLEWAMVKWDKDGVEVGGQVEVRGTGPASYVQM